ncbi:uncharacterized protein [Physcomitrium patens]|nr:uncharacterized protein LOC112275139 isoform X3 [Physcomitrium patens]|eukprot:XP_024360999.1 uncharacterized protein LOC112275139 isoform X3 [Physcomitrella patens]
MTTTTTTTTTTGSNPVGDAGGACAGGAPAGSEVVASSVSTGAGVATMTATATGASGSGGAIESSVVAVRGEKNGVARGGENADEPREGGQESVIVEKRGEHAAVCKWTISQFAKVKARALWSRYFEVGGYDCRLLVYPRGDSQALPGYLSIYLQVTDPRGSSSSKWDCFASYRLCVVNQKDETKSIQRDSWHRFSGKKKSHGWCDFTPSSTVLDGKGGFVVNEAVLITAEILVLHESVSFSRENELPATGGPAPEVLSGKFTWKVHNLSLFKEMIKTQKIMSPVFPAGDCSLRLSVYQSSVSGVDYLSMCLESKDTEKSSVPERSCWCLFRMSVLNQRAGMNHMHRDSYGRFAADNKSGDNTSLGWNDYMKMADFVAPEMGYLVEDTAVFSASFHVIKESSTFSKNIGPLSARANAKKSDGYQGKFMWRIENFTRLKDLLKKRKITGLCIKSRRFQVGNRDCRLIVYPRGQSQPPCHLSMFLEVTDPRNTCADWSCFVSHRLSVVNQRTDERSVTKESQNRYSKAAKDWGWREFVTLTSLFDQDSGFLVQDMVVFSAEVLILKETSTMQELSEYEGEAAASGGGSDTGRIVNRGTFTWRVENFLAFKEIMETRKIFSKFFQAGGCELRIGVYESFDTLCIYLESDQSIGSDPDRNFWVRYRMAVVNVKHGDRTVWKESSICTKTWNNSVLQFMKVSDMVEADAGFLVRDTVVFVCEILDCCPWFEFSDLDVLISDDEQDALSTDPEELLDSDDSEGVSGDEEDIFRSLLARAGFHLSYGDNPPLLLDPSQLQITLREKLLMDAGAVAAFLAGLRVYLDDPAKVKRLLLPTKVSTTSAGGGGGKNAAGRGEASSPSLMNLLMGVKVLQQAIVDLLLDIMVECCQPSEVKKCNDVPVENKRGGFYEGNNWQAAKPAAAGGVDWRNGGSAVESRDSGLSSIDQRLEVGGDGSSGAQAVQSSDSLAVDMPVGRAAALSVSSVQSEPAASQESCVPDTMNNTFSNHAQKPKWPEQSDELLGLIVNSLRALEGAVPQGVPEPRRRPQSAQKIALVLEKAPKHLQPDLIALVPKLVDLSEHSLVAYSLLERLQRPDAEPALRLPMLGALSQLEVSSDIWEQVLQQALDILPELVDEPLAAVMSFVFKAATESQQLLRAVAAVRRRFKKLGPAVSPRVLDVVRSTVSSNADVAEALLRDIDNDSDRSETDITTAGINIVFGDNRDGDGAAQLQAAAEKVAASCWRVADVDFLVEMLTMPTLRIEAQRVFERAIARGAFGEQSVVMVLERRRSQRLILGTRMGASAGNAAASHVQDPLMPGTPGGGIDYLHPVEEDVDFPAVLQLAEALALSRDLRVREFVSTMYAVMFKVYGDEGYHERMLRGLVERATSSTSGPHEVELGMAILTFLVREEEGTARPVLSMMCKVAEAANGERNVLWQQLRAREDDIVRLRNERQAELARVSREKAVLSQRLVDADIAQGRLKAEMRAEIDRVGREKKDMAERIREVENQLEWVRSEREEEIGKLLNEKKGLQDRLRDTEAQLAQLKSRKRDELKRVMKEKNALAERLKTAESARKRFDEDIKRYATESVTREEIRQSLEDEVRRLTQTVGQTEGGLREKEEQVMRCEAYIDGMESKLHACQNYIQTLEASLQEEMSRHAPLYGAGLEALSLSELETLARIHDEGLRAVRLLQQQRGAGGAEHMANMESMANHSPLPPPLGMYATPPPIAVGMPSIMANGMSVHGNGHINGTVGPWYPPT